MIGVFLVLPTYVKLTWRERKARKLREASIAAGRNEPATIRPLVDPLRCMGSGACVKICPEHVLGIIGGQATVVKGASCVGHGACAAVCPVDAIQLVFGSERRGIDIPDVATNFETNVPGLYIAGELGGMGLIANAVEQGKQAAEFALDDDRPKHREAVDLLVIGAGPAGLGAGLRALELGATYKILDQDEFGGAIRHYPRQKLVMTRPMDLPGYGKLMLHTARKEELIEHLEKAVAKTGLKIEEFQRVEHILPSPECFLVQTTTAEFVARRVILAIGRRGSPRKLGCPGEDLEKVAYRLVDAEKYSYQHILVVGGGDSAVEAAVSLGEQPGNRVTLSYRGKDINRPKEDNLKRLQAAVAAGTVDLKLESTVERIDLDRAVLKHHGELLTLPNDFVFVFAGGVLPIQLLTDAGIEIERHHGKKKVKLKRAKPSRKGP
ncbi:MAG: NAD(P)-binding domain-containing protein [Alphaproteobacteria bacterium]|nr:NAD(P)-binding domain-containing protein [Alphaproteobacteria bacterium]